MYVKVYLNRINYSGSTEISLENLQKLQRVHLFSIPFENLDIHYNKEIKLDLDLIYSKIIEQGRGGFCYELNGLFYELLKELGYSVKRISARVYSKEKGFGPEFDHLAVLVKLDKVEYLADVGFGDFTFAPLKFELGISQEDENGIFSIEKEGDYYQVNKKINDEWVPQYIFKDQHRKFEEFKPMCRFQQFDPSSHFRAKKMITIPTIDGRVTLNTENLKITSKNQIENIPIKNEKSFDEALWKYFRVAVEH